MSVPVRTEDYEFEEKKWDREAIASGSKLD